VLPPPTARQRQRGVSPFHPARSRSIERYRG